MSSAGQCRQREGGECTGGEAGGGAMVEAVEEGRFEFNFYGVLAWASSPRARTREISGTFFGASTRRSSSDTIRM